VLPGDFLFRLARHAEDHRKRPALEPQKGHKLAQGPGFVDGRRPAGYEPPAAGTEGGAVRRLGTAVGATAIGTCCVQNV
jgi:hypothetical protein